MIYDICISLVTTSTPILTQKFHLCPFTVNPLLLPHHRNRWSAYYHYNLILPILKFHVNRTIGTPLCLVSFIQHNILRQSLLFLCQSVLPFYC